MLAKIQSLTLTQKHTENKKKVNDTKVSLAIVICVPRY